MFIPRLYYPGPIPLNQPLSLGKEASHHIIKVLKLKEGDTLYLFNGESGEYLAIIKHRENPVIVQAQTFDNANRESPLFLHLGQGLARGEKMDWIIQKSTELGVSAITPLETTKSLVKLEDDRKTKRQTHWQNVAISACEQSGRTAVPEIHLPQKLKAWAAQPFEGLSLFFDPASQHTLQSLIQEHPQTKQFRFAIGPESGWEENEISFLKALGFIEANLGPRILRTETASSVALSLLQGLCGDLG